MSYRYQNISAVKKDGVGTKYFVNNIYPDIPYSNSDTYAVCVLGDRLDLLAFDFYGDTSYWWVIASANSLPGDSLYLEPGLQIRIPSNLPGIINEYKSVNTNR